MHAFLHVFLHARSTAQLTHREDDPHSPDERINGGNVRCARLPQAGMLHLDGQLAAIVRSGHVHLQRGWVRGKGG
jgi:hypothetical protein